MCKGTKEGVKFDKGLEGLIYKNGPSSLLLIAKVDLLKWMNVHMTFTYIVPLLICRK